MHHRLPIVGALDNSPALVVCLEMISKTSVCRIYMPNRPTPARDMIYEKNCSNAELTTYQVVVALLIRNNTRQGNRTQITITYQPRSLRQKETNCMTSALDEAHRRIEDA